MGRRYRFSPRLVPTLAALAAMILFSLLGLWQIGRAHEKEAIQARFDARREAPPLSLAGRLPDTDSLRFRQARVTGRYDPDLTLLVDNQVLDGRPGFYVVSPLRVAGSARWVLVNRGWVPMGPSREQLPAVPPPQGTVTVRGYLSNPSRPPLELGEPAVLHRGEQIVQAIRPARVGALLGGPVLPLELRQQGSAEPQLRKKWFIVNMTPGRHYGYAVQWFALALVVCIVYISLNLHRRPEASEDGEQLPSHDTSRPHESD